LPIRRTENNKSVVSALVTDAYFNPISNTTVAFLVIAPTTNQGTVNTGSAVTDATGRAGVTFTANATTPQPVPLHSGDGRRPEADHHQRERHQAHAL